jgi:ABC-2 type transport system ATP-binding protein
VNESPVIRLRGLRKRFGQRRALDGIDLDIADRQIFGVVGPDGAGKTTLLRTLAGLLEVEAVDATVLGFDVRGPVSDLKARIGYVPQTFSLHRDLSVAENLHFTARLHRISGAEFEARTRDLLEHTGLAPFVDRPTGALSGGMKQKLAVINALLPHPRLLILDEPTAGVDVMARSELWVMLETARTTALVVMSTSYLDEAAACDTLAYLDEGRVVATGTPASLRESTPLELYRAWGEDPRAIARAARALPYVYGARAAGRYARVEVRRERTPGVVEVIRALSNLEGVHVRFSERREPDMESTLLALSGRRAEPAGAAREQSSADAGASLSRPVRRAMRAVRHG